MSSSSTTSTNTQSQHSQAEGQPATMQLELYKGKKPANQEAENDVRDKYGIYNEAWNLFNSQFPDLADKILKDCDFLNAEEKKLASDKVRDYGNRKWEDFSQSDWFNGGKAMVKEGVDVHGNVNHIFWGPGPWLEQS